MIYCVLFKLKRGIYKMIEKIKHYPILAITISTLLTIIFLSLFSTGDSTFLQFINITFYFYSTYIFIGLLLFVVNGGFFDGMSYSFRKMFKRQHQEDDQKEIEPLSQIITIPYFPLLYSGLGLLLINLLSLFIYYL